MYPQCNNGVKTGRDTLSPFLEEAALVTSETASADTATVRSRIAKANHRERRENAPNVTYREVDGDTIQIRDRQNRQEYKETGHRRAS